MKHEQEQEQEHSVWAKVAESIQVLWKKQDDLSQLCISGLRVDLPALGQEQLKHIVTVNLVVLIS